MAFLQVVLTYSPAMQAVFHTALLTLADVALVLAVGWATALAVSLEKCLKRPVQASQRLEPTSHDN